MPRSILGPDFDTPDPVNPYAVERRGYAAQVDRAMRGDMPRAEAPSLDDLRAQWAALAAVAPDIAFELTGLPDIRRGVGEIGLGVRYGSPSQVLSGVGDLGWGALSVLPVAKPFKVLRMLTRLKKQEGGLVVRRPNTYDEEIIRRQGAAKRSEGVNPDGSVPGYEGNLDPLQAGDNWKTIGVFQDANNLTFVVPTTPKDKPGDETTRFKKTGKHYGAFETEQAGQEYMRNIQKSLSVKR